MDDLVKWGIDSPYLAFFAIIIVVPAILRCVSFVVNRTYRCVMVSLRGWPPQHLDADGDWKPLPESAE